MQAKTAPATYADNHNLAVLLENNHLESLKSLCSLLLREVELLATIKIESEESISRRDIISLDEEVERFEVNLIKSALFRSNGNQFQAAQMLGVKYTTLHAKIKRLKIDATEFV